MGMRTPAEAPINWLSENRPTDQGTIIRHTHQSRRGTGFVSIELRDRRAGERADGAA